MLVYKFGGASIKDAEGVRNLAKIVADSQEQDLVIVVSAMGKMTNALEKVYNSYFKSMPDKQDMLKVVKDFHVNLVSELFPETNASINTELEETFIDFEKLIAEETSFEKDFEYDKIVSMGEIISSKIVYAYLKTIGINIHWVDIRTCLRTDETFRDAKIDFEASTNLINEAFKKEMGNKYITQGFIGCSKNGKSTTLGREGSDYTAALLGYFLDAKSITIWKDVPGILNADPRIMPEAVKLKEISYHEAIELAYYGAQVIHPKTIKPIQNKNIPLYVKPFLSHKEDGTVIHDIHENLVIPPVFIIKTNQVLISISPKDFSFIAEDNMSLIFAKLAKYRIKANLMQNSAISFSIVSDYDESKIHYFIGELNSSFKILYNQNLELVTVRHYTDDAIKKVIGTRQVFVRQLSRRTARFVIK